MRISQCVFQFVLPVGLDQLADDFFLEEIENRKHGVVPENLMGGCKKLMNELDPNMQFSVPACLLAPPPAEQEQMSKQTSGFRWYSFYEK